jgi:hypothetical protein
MSSNVALQADDALGFAEVAAIESQTGQIIIICILTLG